MRTPSTDIFGPVEENSYENIEEEVEEEEEPEEEEEKEEDTNSSEEEREVEGDDEPNPWSPLRHKVGEAYLKEVQQCLDRGKSQHYAENTAFNALLPVSRRRLRKTYLERIKYGLTISKTTQYTVKS